MQKLRNIAIIAHVDHGKTTLVDKMILAGNLLRDNAQQNGELVLERDSVHGPPHPLLRDMPDGSGPLDGRPV